MTWSARYIPPSATNWTGRADSPKDSCFFQTIKLLDLNTALPDFDDKAIVVALLGFCCDEGIKRNEGRPGAAEGPALIREVLGKMPVQKQKVVCYDAGDITCTDGDLEASQQALAETVSTLLAHNITPIVIGGGHEMAWGNFQGIIKRYPNEHLAIINFDAHFDMRPLLPGEKGSSGTPFLQMAKAAEIAKRRFDYNCIGIQRTGNTQQLFETAHDYEAQIILADDLHQGNKTKCTDFINRIIFHNQHIYLSLCMDVFASAFAPGVSAPQAMGVTPWQIMPYVKRLAASGKVISYDIAELCPPLDVDKRTARLAANFVYEIIHHHTPFGLQEN
jgi:formiminoglutamase